MNSSGIESPNGAGVEIFRSSVAVPQEKFLLLESMSHGQNGEGRRDSLTFSKCSCLHWSQLASLFKEAFPFLSSREISFELRRSKENSHVCLAGKRVVGFFTYLPNKTTGVAWLNFIAVRKDYRNSGIGKSLLERFADQVSQNGFSRIELAVEKNNWSAIRLYERCGYSRLSREGDKLTYYKDIRPEPLAGRRESAQPGRLLNMLRKAYWWMVSRILVDLNEVRLKHNHQS